MVDRKPPPLAAGGHNRCGFLSGAVVGHDDLELPVPLGEEPFENGGQRIGTVVSRHDHGDLHGFFPASSSLR